MTKVSLKVNLRLINRVYLYGKKIYRGGSLAFSS